MTGLLLELIVELLVAETMLLEEPDDWFICFFFLSNSSKIFLCWSILPDEGFVNAFPVEDDIFRYKYLFTYVAK